MYISIDDFIREWNSEGILTQNILDGLTNESLQQQVYQEGRTLGRIAWHLITSIPEYLNHFGLKLDEVEDANRVPDSAKEIAGTFRRVCSSAAHTIKQQWTDASLENVQNAFGREETNAQILMGLIKHIVHHRGQITVLMRQAGIKPAGVYGPPKEDWIHLGVENPPL
ncbi:MAG: DinB family protein [Bacillus sp. (in: firmicutes)]|uniref:DinB family protein n=1 Tax=Bacillus marasmi TaxID=1926279 RepID=UPI0011C9D3B2|nr:DinB family protein [Bacillus marasmi]